jgi:hypothetical protein
MQINFTPQRRDDELTVEKEADVLTINGQRYDFSSLPDGATIAVDVVPWEWIAGPVQRAAGELNLTLILPNGPAPSRAVAFPSPLIDPPDGPLTIPRVPEPAEDEEPANVDR